jgi:hypothetical protein
MIRGSNAVLLATVQSHGRGKSSGRVADLSQSFSLSLEASILILPTDAEIEAQQLSPSSPIHSERVPIS